jgi:hypothetical protein
MPVLPNQPLNNAVNQNQGLLTQIGQSVLNSVEGQVGYNPTASRQNVNDMFAYSTSNSGGSRTVGPQVVVNYPQANYDWRVRITLPPNSKYFYNDPSNNLLSPLHMESNNGVTSAVAQGINGLFGPSGQTRVGVIFPYTPSVSVTHTANYSPQKLLHNNYAQYFYDNSEVQPIAITGDFTVQNVNEGQYLLATIYFFRSLTKMFFGADPLAGNPPPIVYLNGYGQYYLPNVPCVVTSFNHSMPTDSDYMDIPEPGVTYNPFVTNPVLNSTRLPTTSTITLTVQPIYSRLAQSQRFSLQDFAKGALINSAGSGNPGSAFGATQQASNGGVAGPGGFL